MATNRNTGGIIEPWSGSGWPLSIFVDQNALTEEGGYFCSRIDCGQKNRRILREPWQLGCGHRLCKECLDFIQSLPEDQRECDGCKYEPYDDDTRTPRTEAVSIDHMDVDHMNVDVDVDKQARFDAIQLIETEKQQQQEQQLEPRFCKIDDIGKSAMKDNVAIRELKRMLVRCPYECGTSSKLTIRTIEKHMNVCEQRLVPCEKCAEVIRYSQKSVHAFNTCPLRAVDCPNRCGTEGLKSRDLPKHLAECGKTQLRERCIFCRNDYLSNEVIRDHMMKCVAKCPLGCSESSARVNMEEHLGNPELLKSHLYNISLLFYNVKVKEEEGASPGAGIARIQIASILEKLLQLESKDESLKRKSLAMCLCAVNGQRGLSTATEGEEGSEGAEGAEGAAASEKKEEIDPDMAALADSDDRSRSDTSDDETVNFDAVQAES